MVVDGLGPAFSSAFSVVPADRNGTQLTFDWGHCRVPARQWVFSNGRAELFTFTVSSEPRGDEVLIRLEDLAVVEGDPSARDDGKAEIRPEFLLAAAAPSIVVSSDGQFLRMLDASEGFVQASRALSANNRRLQKLIFTPQQRKAAMIATAKNMWMSWIGSFLGGFWVPERPATQRIFVTHPLGIDIPTQITQEHMGAVADKPGLVLLQMRHESSAADLKPLAKKIYAKLSASPEFTDPEAAKKAIESGLLDRTISVALDPKTARPYRSRFEERIEDGEEGRHIVRDTVFDWDSAECL